MQTCVQSLRWEEPLEKEMATHYSILAWRIPGTEEPGEQQSMGLQRVRHDWATKPPTSTIHEPWFYYLIICLRAFSIIVYISSHAFSYCVLHHSDVQLFIYSFLYQWLFTLFPALFAITNTWNQPQYSSTNEWIKKMKYIYNGILLLLLLSRSSRVRLCATP